MKTATELPRDLTRQCEQHGEYEASCQQLLSKFLIFDHCPKCAEIEQQEREAKEAEQERLANEKRLLSRKQLAGLRARHLNSTFENYKAATQQQQAALSKVKGFSSTILNGGHGNLVLAGKVGTGKTHLSAAMVNAFIERGKGAILIKMPELMRGIKSSWVKDSDLSESDIINEMSFTPLLVLDEIGVQYGSDTEKLVISEIIDNRYQEMLPTVLVSNLDVAGIKACIGERCYDRLREDGGTVVGFDWESFRGAA